MHGGLLHMIEKKRTGAYTPNPPHPSMCSYADIETYVLNGNGNGNADDFPRRLAADVGNQRQLVFFLVDACVIHNTVEPLIHLLTTAPAEQFTGLAIETHRGEIRSSLIDFLRHRFTYGLDEWIRDGVLTLDLLHTILDGGWIDEDAFFNDDDDLIYSQFFAYEICIATAFHSNRHDIGNALVKWCDFHRFADPTRFARLMERMDVTHEPLEPLESAPRA